MTDLRVRPVEEGDLPALYTHQLDPEATAVAGFPSRDEASFFAHWRERILADPTIRTLAVVVDGDVVGSVGAFDRDGRREVTYWMDRASWGRGVATRALSLLLDLEGAQDLTAYTGEHNTGSLRVLEKNGFVRTGDSVVANGMTLLRLDRPATPEAG